jgi:hypothetical protein
MISAETGVVKTKSGIFWGEIAPSDHVVQVYEHEDIFLDTLTGFVGGGINAGDAVIVIATEVHLRALRTRLRSYGLHVDSLIAEKLYIPLDAREVLSRFMVNNWPDEKLFIQTVSGLFEKAGKKGRRIRAFGEMVALLWAEGHSGATVQLEHLWNRFHEKKQFSLFCAYPKAGFTEDPHTSLKDICACHSREIDGTRASVTEVSYRAASA